MNNQWITKYRPAYLKEFYGNSSLKDQISIWLEAPPSAFLIAGETGSGKTTLARIIARHLSNNLIEHNLSNDRGVDYIRKIIDEAQFKPLKGDRKVVIMDECHMMTEVAQRAFLKPLEEPPEHIVWILVTNNPHKLLPEIKNRCQFFTVSKPSKKELITLLKKICKKEGISNIPLDVLDRIIDTTNGIPRSAIGLLQNVSKLGDVTPDKILSMYQEDSNEAIRRSAFNYLKSVYKGNANEALLSLLDYQYKLDIMDIARQIHWEAIQSFVRNQETFDPLVKKLIRYWEVQEIEIDEILYYHAKINRVLNQNLSLDHAISEFALVASEDYE